MNRTALVLGVLALLLVLGVFTGVLLGPTKIGVSKALHALLSNDDPMARVVVWNLRLPRAVSAIVAGACLGMAGCLIQGATRNPLGDPHLFGLGGGAAIVQALVMAGAIRMGTPAIAALSVAASLMGAGVITAFAFRQEISPPRLALVGISVSVLLSAVVTGILAEARVFSLNSIAFLGGSFANRGWQDALASMPYLVLGVLIALPYLGRLNVMALGDQVAANLGANPRRARIMAMTAAGILSGAAVALAGLLGFVGLMVPHFARLLVGHDFRMLILVSVPLGAFATLAADLVARLAFMPSEVPVGMVTALVGAPMMIQVARRVF